MVGEGLVGSLIQLQFLPHLWFGFLIGSLLMLTETLILLEA
jgi:hypothetical protein